MNSTISFYYINLEINLTNMHLTKQVIVYAFYINFLIKNEKEVVLI